MLPHASEVLGPVPPDGRDVVRLGVSRLDAQHPPRVVGKAPVDLTPDLGLPVPIEAQIEVMPEAFQFAEVVMVGPAAEPEFGGDVA
jgi:hypothetical protein